MLRFDPKFSPSRLVMTLAHIRWGNRKYRRWRERNPNKTFGEWYVEKNLAKIAKGQVQPNLGRVIEPHYNKMAEKTLIKLRALGLKSYHRVVDYGCGSLRVGRVVVPQLERGNYWGLDVSDDFFDMARDVVGHDTFDDKAVRLDAISNESLNEVRKWQPDVVCCFGVIFHIPPNEVELTFERLACLIQGSTVGLVKIIVWPGPTVQISAESWLYNRSWLLKQFESRGLSTDLIPLGDGFVKGLSLPTSSYWARVTRVS